MWRYITVVIAIALFALTFLDFQNMSVSNNRIFKEKTLIQIKLLSLLYINPHLSYFYKIQHTFKPFISTFWMHCKKILDFYKKR
ncbi:hypothetical protein HanPI659440_Chr06g0225431 [Helianthus annuus]|nr:hypothetical protein HanPI659440_Chr06g0225431 [Helianthus annuus]